jgi:hypothetical protein
MGHRVDETVAALADHVDDSVLAEFGDRVGDGIPLDYLRLHISDQGMADLLGLDDADLKRVTKAEKAGFARETLRALQSDTDADLCPGLWLVPITDGQSTIYLGFSVRGYSFSGVERQAEGAFLAESDFVAYVCCTLGMLFCGQLCVDGVPVSAEQIDDSTLLRLVWGQ